MKILIFVSILNNFTGLPLNKIEPLCQKYEEFMAIEYRMEKTYDKLWLECANDKACNSIKDSIEEYLDVCEAIENSETI